MRALAYIRVSVVGDRAARGRFESPDLQRDAIRTWAATRGIEIAGEIHDLNRSGGTLTRPGLTEARQRLRAGEADGIIVARSDRASRNTIQGLSLMDELQAEGKWIAATDGTIDSTTPEGRMTTTVILAASERELARFREQSKIVHRRAIIDKGRHMGPAPFGYGRDPVTGGLVADPERAPWVLHAFQRRADGAGWEQISRELDTAGVRQWNGRRLNAHLLRRMISRRVYVGEASHGDNVHRGAHPALLDEASWMAAQRARPAVRSAPSTPRIHDESLLRGLLRCAGCRYVLKRMVSSHGKPPRWRCRTVAGKSATHECGAPAMLTGREAIEVERIVVSRFMELAGAVQVGRADDDGEDVAALERRLADAEALLDELASLDVRRELGADRWGRLVRDARESARDAQERVASARARLRVSPAADVASLQEEWDAMLLAERQEALRSMVQAVFVAAGGGPLGGRVGVVAVWEPVELPRKGGGGFVARPWVSGGE